MKANKPQDRCSEEAHKVRPARSLISKNDHHSSGTAAAMCHCNDSIMQAGQRALDSDSSDGSATRVEGNMAALVHSSALLSFHVSLGHAAPCLFIRQLCL